MDDHLTKEANTLTELLEGKSLVRVWRHRPTELGIEFSDGSRLFVNAMESALELTVTQGGGN